MPHELNARYYAQRASAGLIISEATQISPQGQGYSKTPGIQSAAQIAGWRLVTNAVHERGGKIFLQLWHVGRISHPLTLGNSDLPVAPSAIKPAGKIYTDKGMQPFVTPRPLATNEIPSLIEDFRRAAVNAKEADFDGVENKSPTSWGFFSSPWFCWPGQGDASFRYEPDGRFEADGADRHHDVRLSFDLP